MGKSKRNNWRIVGSSVGNARLLGRWPIALRSPCCAQAQGIHPCTPVQRMRCTPSGRRRACLRRAARPDVRVSRRASCDREVATDRWASSTEIRKADRSRASGPPSSSERRRRERLDQTEKAQEPLMHWVIHWKCAWKNASEILNTYRSCGDDFATGSSNGRESALAKRPEGELESRL